MRTRWMTTSLLLLTATAFAQDPTIDRGDPAEGRRLARKIAGRYRSTQDNGDVTGRHYKTTDTLTITAVGPASIHFDTSLNFFNGHTCGLSGGALYRKNGSFVFDDDPKNQVAEEPLCRLAIVPSATGVDFKDLTGGCKMMYCGARGSWNGEGFTFAERHQSTSPTSPH